MSKTSDAIVRQIMGRCKHFDGLNGGDLNDDSKKCKRGRIYRGLVGGEQLGWMKRAPCLARNDTAVECEWREFPTEDEAQAEAQADEERTQHIFAAMMACAEDSNAHGFVDNRRDMTGQIVCPACGGTLKYSRAGYNGHIWGKCETVDCLAWMQ